MKRWGVFVLLFVALSGCSMMMPGAVFDVINQAYHLYDDSTNATQSEYYIWNTTVRSNEIMIVFDFGNSEFKPVNYTKIVPFIIGNLSMLGSGYYDWEKVTNGGITSGGSGSQVCYYVNNNRSEYIVILPVPLEGDIDLRFKPANYNPTGWSELISSNTSFWASVGVLSAPDDNVIHVHNGFIDYIVNPYYDTNTLNDNSYHFATMIDNYKKAVKVEVYYQGDWTLHLPEKTSVAYAVDFYWYNVPASIVCQADPNLVWYPFASVVSNTADSSYFTGCSPMLTGNMEWMHLYTGVTWDPPKGMFLNTDSGSSTAYIYSVAVPAGSRRSFRSRWRIITVGHTARKAATTT
jgi:hypothetical protein